jgi:hypothetical protein
MRFGRHLRSQNHNTYWVPLLAAMCPGQGPGDELSI